MRRTRVTAGLAVVAVGAVLLAALAGYVGPARGHASGPFAWLQPGSPPSGWHLARTQGGVVLPYPPGWTSIKTDRGTASVALLHHGGRIDGYLNATPRQGNETLANWIRFRPQHNGEEGDRGVRLLAATTKARFQAGRGACVIDTYTTSKASYQEIACLVSGPRSSAVVVAAAPSALWEQRAATLERAVSSFVA
jgi:hypothetical protein